MCSTWFVGRQAKTVVPWPKYLYGVLLRSPRVLEKEGENLSSQVSSMRSHASVWSFAGVLTNLITTSRFSDPAFSKKYTVLCFSVKANPTRFNSVVVPAPRNPLMWTEDRGLALFSTLSPTPVHCTTKGPKRIASNEGTLPEVENKFCGDVLVLFISGERHCPRGRL